MIYLGWYDDTAKKSAAEKIEEAIERYEFKYGVRPNICLVSEREMVEHPQITVRPAAHLRPNYFYLGYDEAYGPVVATSPLKGNRDNAPIQIATARAKVEAPPKRQRKAA